MLKRTSQRVGCIGDAPWRGVWVGRGTPTHRQAAAAGPPLAGGSGARRGERELEAESGALAALGFDPDAAVHPLHELAADVEAEAGAADAVRHVGVEPVELV